QRKHLLPGEFERGKPAVLPRAGVRYDLVVRGGRGRPALVDDGEAPGLTAGTGRAPAVQLDAVPLQREAQALSVGGDERVERAISEVFDGATAAADHVMVMVAGGELVPDAAVLEHHAAHELGILEQPDRPKDSCAADVRRGGGELLDGKGA